MFKSKHATWTLSAALLATFSFHRWETLDAVLPSLLQAISTPAHPIPKPPLTPLILHTTDINASTPTSSSTTVTPETSHEASTTSPKAPSTSKGDPDPPSKAQTLTQTKPKPQYTCPEDEDEAHGEPGFLFFCKNCGGAVLESVTKWLNNGEANARCIGLDDAMWEGCECWEAPEEDVCRLPRHGEGIKWRNVRKGDKEDIERRKKRKEDKGEGRNENKMWPPRKRRFISSIKIKTATNIWQQAIWCKEIPLQHPIPS
ncbi:hypothetical protein M011DRAFT_523485 [Sporormia fimetaria CBS 119925]|uniref:Uncharacterized protein n=1 Tax=Sporormia fimetaria CBS 119925 TaxID=1340428 RepID=A0A6A6VLS9_9PLEO|nr:hypothetical protein M011DRAFT_523485 [Sporormia fimetaria CBS 119925]